MTKKKDPGALAAATGADQGAAGQQHVEDTKSGRTRAGAMQEPAGRGDRRQRVGV